MPIDVNSVLGRQRVPASAPTGPAKKGATLTPGPALAPATAAFGGTASLGGPPERKPGKAPPMRKARRDAAHALDKIRGGGALTPADRQALNDGLADPKLKNDPEYVRIATAAITSDAFHAGKPTGKSFGGFVKNLAGDAVSIATSFPHLGVAAAKNVGGALEALDPVYEYGQLGRLVPLPGAGAIRRHAPTHIPGAGVNEAAELDKQMAIAAAEDYKARWGPVFTQGDLTPLYTHPGLALLDAGGAYSLLGKAVGVVGRASVAAGAASPEGAIARFTDRSPIGAARRRPPKVFTQRLRGEDAAVPEGGVGGEAGNVLEQARRPRSSNPITAATQRTVFEPLGKRIAKTVEDISNAQVDKQSVVGRTPLGSRYSTQAKYGRASAADTRGLQLEEFDSLLKDTESLTRPYLRAVVQSAGAGRRAAGRAFKADSPENIAINLHIKGVLDSPHLTPRESLDHFIKTRRDGLTAAREGERIKGFSLKVKKSEKALDTAANLPDEYLSLDTMPPAMRHAVEEGKKVARTAQDAAIEAGLVSPAAADTAVRARRELGITKDDDPHEVLDLIQEERAQLEAEGADIHGDDAEAIQQHHKELDRAEKTALRLIEAERQIEDTARHGRERAAGQVFGGMTYDEDLIRPSKSQDDLHAQIDVAEAELDRLSAKRDTGDLRDQVKAARAAVNDAVKSKKADAVARATAAVDDARARIAALNETQQAAPPGGRAAAEAVGARSRRAGGPPAPTPRQRTMRAQLADVFGRRATEPVGAPEGPAAHVAGEEHALRQADAFENAARDLEDRHTVAQRRATGGVHRYADSPLMREARKTMDDAQHRAATTRPTDVQQGAQGDFRVGGRGRPGHSTGFAKGMEPAAGRVMNAMKGRHNDETMIDDPAAKGGRRAKTLMDYAHELVDDIEQRHDAGHPLEEWERQVYDDMQRAEVLRGHSAAIREAFQATPDWLGEEDAVTAARRAETREGILGAIQAKLDEAHGAPPRQEEAFAHVDPNDPLPPNFGEGPLGKYVDRELTEEGEAVAIEAAYHTRPGYTAASGYIGPGERGATAIERGVANRMMNTLGEQYARNVAAGLEDDPFRGIPIDSEAMQQAFEAGVAQAEQAAGGATGQRAIGAPAGQATTAFERAPRDEAAWMDDYLATAERVKAAEKNPGGRMTPEEVALWDKGRNWQEFSRVRGYTDAEIADFQRYLDLVDEGRRLGLSDDEIHGLWVHPPKPLTAGTRPAPRPDVGPDIVPQPNTEAVPFREGRGRAPRRISATAAPEKAARGRRTFQAFVRQNGQINRELEDLANRAQLDKTIARKGLLTHQELRAAEKTLRAVEKEYLLARGRTVGDAGEIVAQHQVVEDLHRKLAREEERHRGGFTSPVPPGVDLEQFTSDAISAARARVTDANVRLEKAIEKGERKGIRVAERHVRVAERDLRETQAKQAASEGHVFDAGSPEYLPERPRDKTRPTSQTQGRTAPSSELRKLGPVALPKRNKGLLLSYFNINTQPKVVVYALLKSLEALRQPEALAKLLARHVLVDQDGRIISGPKVSHVLRVNHDSVVLMNVGMLRRALRRIDSEDPRIQELLGRNVGSPDVADLRAVHPDDLPEGGPGDAGGSPLDEVFREADVRGDVPGVLEGGEWREGVRQDDWVLLPKSVADEWKSLSRKPSAFDDVQGMWKRGTLAFTPRWYFYNLVGNSLQYGVMAGADVRSIRQANRIEGAGLPSRLAFGKAKPGSGGGVREAIDPRMTESHFSRDVGGTSLDPLKERVTDPFLAMNARFENILRRAAYLNRAKKAAVEHGMVTRRQLWNMNDAQLKDLLERMPDDLKAHALTEALHFMGDYQNFSWAERTFLKRAFPFYSWLRVIGRLTLLTPIRYPVRSAVLANLANIAMETIAPGDIARPWYDRGQVHIGGASFSTLGINPAATIAGPLAAGIEEGIPGALAELSGNATPFLRPVLAAAGVNSLTGSALTSPQGYQGSVEQFGFDPTRLSPLTLSSTGVTPRVPTIDLLGQVVPLWGLARQALSGQDRPFDTTSTPDILLHRLGIGRPARDLFIRSRYDQPRRALPFGLSAGASWLGAPVKTYDPQAEIDRVNRDLGNALKAITDSARREARRP